MPFCTKNNFLKTGIKPSTTATATTTTTTPDPTCDICYESVPVAKPQNRFAASVEYMSDAARAILFGDNQTKWPCPIARPCYLWTRGNTMMEIKACGHRFCRACLDNWLADQNTCPMCRDVLFFLDERRSYVFGERRVLSRQEVLEIRDMGAPAAARVEARSAFRREERQGAWDYRNLWDSVVYTHAERLEEWSTDFLRAVDEEAGYEDVLVMENERHAEGMQATRGLNEELREYNEVEEEDHDYDEEEGVKEITDMFEIVRI